MKPPVGPIDASERLLVVDILRGVAIFGILVVNMDVYASPLAQPRLGGSASAALVDRVAGALIRLLAEGKFYTLFSFLFGFGLTVQMARAEARGASFVPLYVRRLLVLMFIGAGHALLLWYGDILVTYAVLGFLLLLFRRRGPRTLLVWAAVALLLPILMEGAFAGVLLGVVRLPVAGPILNQVIEQAPGQTEGEIEHALQVYGHGSFRQIFAQRLQDLKFVYAMGTFTMPTVFAMFLLGLYAGRLGVFRDPEAFRPLLRRVLWWGLILGGAGNVIYVVAGDLSGDSASLLGFASTSAHAMGAPALMLGYVAAISILVQSEVWRRRLAPLAPVGRMALTNYLAQTVVCTTLFYGYGVGLFGKIGVAEGLGLAAVIYLGQVFLSGWWFRRFAFGPMEWLWRSLTYGRRRPP